MSIATWEKTTEHIYDPQFVKCDVYRKRIRRGFVYLMDNKQTHFTFTVSCGANSSRSFTGCFFGDEAVMTVQDAMNALDKRSDL